MRTSPSDAAPLGEAADVRRPARPRSPWLACAGVLLAVWALAALAQAWSAASAATLLLIAPLATSAVLLFVHPESPFATPWAVIGGYAVSALVGVTAAQWIASVPLACAVAAAGALVAMLALRCLHPPGAPVAIMPVLAGAVLQAEGYGYVWPALLGAALLVVLARAGRLLQSAQPRRAPP